MKRQLALTVLFCGLVCSASGQVALEWTELPELPPQSGATIQPGLAGAFVGISNNALIVAGGATFPQPVWESDQTWHDDIYVLIRDSDVDESYHWKTGQKLEKPVAYGASVSTDHGVVCIGGNDAKRTYSDVFLLRWDPGKEQVIQESLPSLPEPRANAGAAVIGDTVYVAGGTTGLDLETAQQSFWSLDLSKADDEWQRILPWPGPSRAFAIVTSQHNGVEDCLNIISGRRIGESGATEFLTDVYEFAPTRYQTGEYDAETGFYTGDVNPWRRRSDAPRCVMAGRHCRRAKPYSRPWRCRWQHVQRSRHAPRGTSWLPQRSLVVPHHHRHMDHRRRHSRESYGDHRRSLGNRYCERSHCHGRRRNPPANRIAEGVAGPAAQERGALRIRRLRSHLRLPGRDDLRRCVLLLPQQEFRRLLPRWTTGPLVCRGDEHLRHDAELDHFHRDPGQSLRDRLGLLHGQHDGHCHHACGHSSLSPVLSED